MVRYVMSVERPGTTSVETLHCTVYQYVVPASLVPVSVSVSVEFIAPSSQSQSASRRHGAYQNEAEMLAQA